MARWQRYLFFGALWCVVAGYCALAMLRSQRLRSRLRVEQLEIVIADSTAHGSLIGSEQVIQALAKQRISTLGEPIDSVDLVGIEQLIARNGFVERVDASVDDRGRLCIAIAQREPVLRLRLDSRDGYVTREGYLFATPPRSSRYVPVVTGSYRLPVPRDYTGSVAAWVEHALWLRDTTILGLERQKYPFMAAQRNHLLKVRRERYRRLDRHPLHWLGFETDEEYALRKEAFDRQQADSVRKYRYLARRSGEEVDRLSARQESLRREQKKLQKNYEDFVKLLTFVEQLETTDFWSEEVVQIIATTASSGALNIALVPRSGPFTIQFGRLEEVEEKFRKLDRFYERGLPHVGWERFREVDVRYSDRVVCR